MNKINSAAAILLIGMLALAACAPAATDTPPAPIFEQPAVSGTPLPLTAVLNANYQPSEMVQGPFQLTNGVYQDPNAQVDIRLLEDWIVFGDLNADGAGDAAALVAESFGGSGVFMNLVVFLSEDGRPVQVRAVPLGDRVQPQGLQMEGGEVTVGLLVHTPNDPLCCPTQPQSWTYLLYERRLIQVGVTSQIPGGGTRAITISDPPFGAAVSAQLRLAGSCTISPFENTLVYRVLDLNENQLLQGPLMVSAPDMGAPGTFDEIIDLSALPGGLLRVEVFDMSMADGSTLAKDSVFVLK